MAKVTLMFCPNCQAMKKPCMCGRVDKITSRVHCPECGGDMLKNRPKVEYREEQETK